jgi:lysophospholipase L1-like esterase
MRAGRGIAAVAAVAAVAAAGVALLVRGSGSGGAFAAAVEVPTAWLPALPPSVGSCEAIRSQLTAVPPPSGSGPLAVFLGDSYTAGVGAAEPALGWAVLSARALGWRPIVLGLSGSGFSNPGPCGALPFGAALPRIERAEPAVVVIEGGLNDIRHDLPLAPAEPLLASLRAALPTARLIVVGPAEPELSYGPGVRAADVQLRGYATQVGADFVDWSGALPASGVSRDQLHPNSSGHVELAYAFVHAVRGEGR